MNMEIEMPEINVAAVVSVFVRRDCITEWILDAKSPCPFDDLNAAANHRFRPWPARTENSIRIESMIELAIADDDGRAVMLLACAVDLAVQVEESA